MSASNPLFLRGIYQPSCSALCTRPCHGPFASHPRCRSQALARTLQDQVTELQVELEQLEAVMLARFNALLVRKKQAMRALHKQLEVARQAAAIAEDETAEAKLQAGRIAVAALRDDVAAAVSKHRFPTNWDARSSRSSFILFLPASCAGTEHHPAFMGPLLSLSVARHVVGFCRRLLRRAQARGQAQRQGQALGVVLGAGAGAVARERLPAGR